jgi:hypothetical protein
LTIIVMIILFLIKHLIIKLTGFDITDFFCGYMTGAFFVYLYFVKYQKLKL